jgi:hypothetical protein
MIKNQQAKRNPAGPAPGRCAQPGSFAHLLNRSALAFHRLKQRFLTWHSKSSLWFDHGTRPGRTGSATPSIA